MLKDIDLSTLETELRNLGETAVLDGKDSTRWSIRGVTPILTVKPASQEAAAEALAFCDRSGIAVFPWGGGTQQRLGRGPRSAGVVLQTSALNRIIEYEPADLTVTVETGLPLLQLQTELAGNRQWLALDAQLLHDATVGGVVATNVNGPRRIRYGGVRDLVIGTRTAGVDGKLTRAGGKVVKNVTGYDLNKAHIGALGTLGLLTEISFKIAPRPEVERSWFGVFPTADAAATAQAALLRLPVPPSAIDLMSHRVARTAGLAVLPGQWVLLGAASGFQEQVDRYLREFETAAGAAGAVSSEPLSDRTASGVWNAYDTSAAELRWSADALTCRMAVPPAQGGRIAGLAGHLGGEPMVWGHAHGGVFWSIPANAVEDATIVGRMRQAAEAADGALVVENWPDSLGNIDVWGRTGGPVSIMEAIKKQFDPKGTLNPGRYVGSI